MTETMLMPVVPTTDRTIVPGERVRLRSMLGVDAAHRRVLAVVRFLRNTSAV